VQQLFTSTQRLGQTAPVLEILKQPLIKQSPASAKPNPIQSFNWLLVTIQRNWGSLPTGYQTGVTLRGMNHQRQETRLLVAAVASPTFARQDVTLRAEKDSTITGVTN